MDKTIPKGKIVISLHQLYVEVAHEASYPDQMHDMSSRALQLFTTALTIAKESGMDIRDFDFQDFEDDDEDDDWCAKIVAIALKNIIVALTMQ